MSEDASVIKRKIDLLYRHDYPKIFASLVRLFGHHNIDLVEDMLQEAFHTALVRWSETSIPKNPSAWLIQTARNRAIDLIRTQKNRLHLSEQYAELLGSEWTAGLVVDEAFDEPFIKDEQLRMIFLCCSTEVKLQNQLPFILKALCGFSNSAIANALVLPEETVKKRVTRTKQQFKELPFLSIKNETFAMVVDRVHVVLYLLFNEGCHHSGEQSPIYLEMCQEAIALLRLVVEHPHLGNKETISLFALMHFHIARVETRLDKSGNLIPLNLQHRERWDQGFINAGAQLLATASNFKDTNQGRFFIEAAIALEHCKAPSFAMTNWQAIVSKYEALVSLTGSDVARLNLVVAYGYAGSLEAAFLLMDQLTKSSVLSKSHMLDATLAHLHAMTGDKEKALAYAKASCNKGGTAAEQKLMFEQVTALLAQRG